MAFQKLVRLIFTMTAVVVSANAFTSRVYPQDNPPFKPCGGTLSPYLVGTFDLRNGQKTVLHIINPTNNGLKARITFFSPSGSALCFIDSLLSNNSIREIDVSRCPKIFQKINFGVVKIVTFQPDGDSVGYGAVGYQRQYIRGRLMRTYVLASEAPLHSIPLEILNKDLPSLLKGWGNPCPCK